MFYPKKKKKKENSPKTRVKCYGFQLRCNCRCYVMGGKRPADHNGKDCRWNTVDAVVTSGRTWPAYRVSEDKAEREGTVGGFPFEGKAPPTPDNHPRSRTAQGLAAEDTSEAETQVGL